MVDNDINHISKIDYAILQKKNPRPSFENLHFILNLNVSLKWN